MIFLYFKATYFSFQTLNHFTTTFNVLFNQPSRYIMASSDLRQIRLYGLVVPKIKKRLVLQNVTKP